MKHFIKAKKALNVLLNDVYPHKTLTSSKVKETCHLGEEGQKRA